MRPLQEGDVIRVMREEWASRVSRLAEAVDVVMNSKVEGGGEQPVIAPELKVRHKASQLRYTVDSVGSRDVILRTPEGDRFLVDAGEFEREYQLD